MNDFWPVFTASFIGALIGSIAIGTVTVVYKLLQDPKRYK